MSGDSVENCCHQSVQRLEPAIDGRSKWEQQQRQKSEYLENVKTYIVKMHRQHTCWPNSRELTDSMTEANQNTSE
jgi:hypothetical protein